MGPPPTVPRALPSALTPLGARHVRTRADRAVLTAWDPDAPEQHDGPLGLPLHSIAAAFDADLSVVAARARAGGFSATLDLVTVVARRDF